MRILLQYYYRRFNWLFGGRFQSLSITCWSHFFLQALSSLFFSLHFWYTTPLIIILVDHNTWSKAIPALCWPRTGRPKICAIALEVLHCLKTYTQHPWLCLSWHLHSCNSKILPNIMWCVTLWLLGICIDFHQHSFRWRKMKASSWSWTCYSLLNMNCALPIISHNPLHCWQHWHFNNF